MKRLLLALTMILISVSAHATPDFTGEYIPSQIKEKVIAASLIAKTNNVHFSCVITLFMNNSSNYYSVPGKVVFTNFNAGGRNPQVKTSNVAFTSDFLSLRSIANQISVTNNFTTNVTNSSDSYSYELKVMDKHPERLAYDAGFNVQSSGFQQVVSTPINTRAMNFIYNICKNANKE